YMKFKKLFIIIAPIILTILLIIVFYILFFRDINIQNSDNNLENSDLINNEEMSEENLGLKEENEENFSNTSTLEEGDPNKGLNIEIDGFKYCRYDEECFKNLFLECNTGNHINFVDENSPYSFSIVNKYEDNCLLLIQNLKDIQELNTNCKIPLSEISENLLDNFLNLNQTTLDKYCK
ncbi:hypothetical protein K9L04_00375, partial [Patescibacteria group bacterium]|nr:hypothetical protein [Patescibacteria group bacterium]